MTFEQAVSALATKTGMSESDWSDFLAADDAGQKLIVKTYADMSWAKSPNVLSDVISILTVLGTIAGAVSGISGAIGAVSALKSI